MLTYADPVTRWRLAAERPRHAVVIGSGFGGLAAGVRLSALGYRVTVLERQPDPGGRAGVFSQDGHRFDRGPTIVTAPFLFEELWALCGRRMADDVDLRRLDPFYRLAFDDGSVIDCADDAATMRETVRTLSPGDVDGYDRFLLRAREICRIGFEQLSDKPFGKLRDMLRIAPDLIRLQGYRSVHGFVAAHVRDPRLRVMLSFHPLLIGGNPFRAPAIYCLIPDLERRWGVHYPMGGVGRLVAGLVSLIEGEGGTVRCNADVASIMTRDGRATGVRLAGGEELKADVVVSNADPAWTYGHVEGAGAPRGPDWRLRRANYSMGLFVLYFGTDRRYSDVGHHTILLGPRYGGLLADIFDRKRLAPDFSLYLHRPTATDPSVAPAGRDTFYALCPVPNLAGDVDWSVEGPRRRDAIVRRLSETVLPDLSRHIVTSSFSTPEDFESRYLSPFGSGFSLEPRLTQSAWFRPHNRSGTVANLYLVGAGTHPGAGLPGVLSSARILDRVVPHAHALAT